MIDPFAFANLKSCSSCCLDAAVPVGLFGEQKKIKSVLGAIDRFGKKEIILRSTLHVRNVFVLSTPCFEPPSPTNNDTGINICLS